MTKIDIISGFLGAGKTTFIKKMIDEVFQGEKIVLIENEFGEVGIDGGFLKDAGIQITEMNSGCICCSLVGDFGKNLNEVITKYHPDRILIEPSGVGKLSDVMKSVIDIEKEQDVKLNGLITVVNATKASKQIEYATTVVLSRTQNATPEQLELCVKQIQALNAKAAIITTPWDDIKGEQILKVMEGQDSLEMKLMAEEHAKAEAEEHEHEHHHDHDHEEHEHHHDHEHEHDENCTCGCHDDHDHEHHHDHDEHEHHHDHEEHEHHHDHDHEEHEHHHDHEHEHDENCTCGCHDHDHHHHHHADDVFTSWGKETPHKFTREKIEEVLKTLCETDDYGTILRAKGMVEDENGSWIYFDMVPGEYELRDGEPDYTGRLCVIGTDIEEHRLEELFGIA